MYLIKDLARLSGFSIYTIKYYIKEGLIKEVGRSPETNFRYFDDTTVNQLKRIREERLKGKSIKEIKLLLNKGTS
ncbi:MAG: MerR family transcriptional regulator [Candidatus Omnitrophica bacterium]|nr:MerR family transcriptional regulator [Candidatus Omnitrophota bacterium]